MESPSIELTCATRAAPATRRAGVLVVLAWAYFFVVPCANGQNQKTSGTVDAGQGRPMPIFKADVNVVSIFATVRDRNGALIPNIGKEAFTVLDDGKPQTIKYFTRETDLPLKIAVLVDVSGSERTLIDSEREAAAEFFVQAVGKDDMASLVRFGPQWEVLQESTNSAKSLITALGRLAGFPNSFAIPQSGQPIGQIYTDSGSGAEGGLQIEGQTTRHPKPRGTILYDTVSFAARDFNGEGGRRAIVQITDGVDQGSRVTLEDAIEAAGKAGVVIYSIEYCDPSFYGGVSLVHCRGRRSQKDFRLDRWSCLQSGGEELVRGRLFTVAG